MENLVSKALAVGKSHTLMEIRALKAPEVVYLVIYLRSVCVAYIQYVLHHYKYIT